MAMIQYNSDGQSYSVPVEARPLEGELKMTGHNIPLGDETNQTAYCYGSAFDGRYLWQTYTIKSSVTRTDTLSGESIEFPIKNNLNGNTNLNATTYLSQSIVFDGTHVWLLPHEINSLVRIDPQTGKMTGYSSKEGTNNWYDAVGGIFDGTNIWMICKGQIVKLDPETGALTGMKSIGTTIYSITYDGQNLWLLYTKSKLIKVTLPDLDTKEYSLPISTSMQNVHKCIYGGTSVWILLSPTSASYKDVVIRFNPDTEIFTEYSTADGVNGNTDMDVGPYACTHGTFDGKYLWLPASWTNQLVRVDTQTGSMRGFSFSGPNIGKWKNPLSTLAGSITYDGNNLWITPYNTNRFLKVSSADSEDPDTGSITVTHKYQAESGATLQSDTRHYATLGDAYTATAPTIAGYTYLGHKLDGGLLQPGSTATIDDVQGDHVIAFVYKENEGSGPDPGEKTKNCARVKIELIGCTSNQLIKDVCGLINESECDCDCSCNSECEK